MVEQGEDQSITRLKSHGSFLRKFGIDKMQIDYSSSLVTAISIERPCILIGGKVDYRTISHRCASYSRMPALGR